MVTQWGQVFCFVLDCYVALTSKGVYHLPITSPHQVSAPTSGLFAIGLPHACITSRPRDRCAAVYHDSQRRLTFKKRPSLEATTPATCKSSPDPRFPRVTGSLRHMRPLLAICTRAGGRRTHGQALRYPRGSQDRSPEGGRLTRSRRWSILQGFGAAASECYNDK